jgi:hypothetical protein
MPMMRTTAAAMALILVSSGLALAQSSDPEPSTPRSTGDWSSGASGPSTMPVGAVERDVRGKLADKGYDTITSLRQDKDGWMATALKDGKQVLLDIDHDCNIAVTK